MNHNGTLCNKKTQTEICFHTRMIIQDDGRNNSDTSRVLNTQICISADISTYLLQLGNHTILNLFRGDDFQ